MSTQKPLRKAIFPVAGMGTRFLPATKSVPKEMLTVVDRPVIDYAVREAIEAGCDTLIFITGRSKQAIANYFDRNPELEAELEAKQKKRGAGNRAQHHSFACELHLYPPSRTLGFGACSTSPRSMGQKLRRRK